MNTVNRPIAEATAHKLRSAAAAILADAAKQADARLTDSLTYEASEIQKRADSIEEQAKPAIEEPLSFASVVRTKSGGLFVRIGASVAWPWMSGDCRRTWGQLHVVEVLRVGIGDDPRPAQDDAYLCGRNDLKDQLRKHYIQLASSAITFERQDAWRRAIETLDALS